MSEDYFPLIGPPPSCTRLRARARGSRRVARAAMLKYIKQSPAWTRDYSASELRSIVERLL